MLRFFRIVAGVLLVAASIVVFEQVRHSMIYQTNADVLNQLIRDGNFRDPKVQDHFRALSLFRNVEAMLYCLAGLGAGLVAGLLHRLQSLPVLAAVVLAGIWLGKLLSPFSVFKSETLQLYGIAMIGIIIVASVFALLRRTARGT